MPRVKEIVDEEESAQVLPAPIKWAQKEKSIFLVVPLADFKIETFQLTDRKLYIKGTQTEQVSKQTKVYEVDLQFWAEIDSDNYRKSPNCLRVELDLPKKQTDGPWWPRLLSSDEKVPWLSFEFGQFREEDEEETVYEPPEPKSLGEWQHFLTEQQTVLQKQEDMRNEDRRRKKLRQEGVVPPPRHPKPPSPPPAPERLGPRGMAADGSMDALVRHPFVKWCQRLNVVWVKILVDDCDSIEDLSIDKGVIHFRGKGGAENRIYECHLELFAEVVEDRWQRIDTDRYIELIIPKVNEDIWWLRLVKSDRKSPHIKIDFERWLDWEEVAEAAKKAKEKRDADRRKAERDAKEKEKKRIKERREARVMLGKSDVGKPDAVQKQLLKNMKPEKQQPRPEFERSKREILEDQIRELQRQGIEVVRTDGGGDW